MCKLQEKTAISERPIRWELGSCWIQHLKTSEDTNSSRSPQNDKAEAVVKGLRKQFKMQKKRERLLSSERRLDDEEETDSWEN